MMSFLGKSKLAESSTSLENFYILLVSQLPQNPFR
jgi:hypothetical protein